jgi:3-deoxy-D-manno-octulosonic-acid transferase
MYTLYSVLLALGVLVASPFWIYKALKEKKYIASFRQRLGWKLPEVVLAHKPVWIHAVSVGEVLAAKCLISALQKTQVQSPIILSTITITGQSLAKQEVRGAAAIFYFPFDWNFCVQRFLERFQPRAVILMEKEIWPNFMKACSRRRVPVFLANGRLSEKSFARYSRIKRFMRDLLRRFEAIGVQTHEDRRRFLELGAIDEQVKVTGNLKFDFPFPDIKGQSDLLGWIHRALVLDSESQVIVVGSSMKGEELLFLTAFRRVQSDVPEARLILAPRHPERFAEVAMLLRESGIPFRRRSQHNGAESLPGARILLLDTIGELRAVYSLASVAVIGGSFLPFGGHNLLEPAALGKAIVFGPEMSNFAEMSRLFLHEHAARQTSIDSLPRALTELLQNAKARNLLGHNALSTFRQNQGATQNTLDFLKSRIP